MFSLAKAPALRSILINKPTSFSRSILGNVFSAASNITLLSSSRSNFLLEKYFATKAKASSKSKSAKKAAKPKPKPKAAVAPAKSEDKEKKKLKLQKEKERIQAQREKEKEKLQKEKEKEKLQKEKEKEKALKEKEKERLQKEKEKGKKKVDENKPKRSANPFTFYYKATFPAITKANPGKKVTDYLRYGLDKWNKLSDNEKKPYLEQAAADKKRYLAEMETYKKDLPPKRPLSGYIIYANEVRDSVKGDSVTEIIKEVSKKWNSLSAGEKQKYQKLAEKAKAEYQKKLDKWKASHPQEE